jgi:hypothetical protein
MTKLDLKKLLLEEKINQDAYSLEGGLPNEAFCLDKNFELWEVYYSERGIKSGLKKFDTENEACEYFYKLLISQW